MSIRGKTAAVLLPLLVVVLVSMVAVERGDLRRGYARLEQASAEQDAHRVSSAIDHELDTLGQLTRLDSVWDAFYGHVQAGDVQAIVDDDLVPADLSGSYDMVAALVTRADGSVLVGGGISGAGFEARPASLESAEAVRQVASIEITERARCGLWRDGGRTLLYCGNAIVHGDGSGPAAGSLVFFKALDSSMLTRIGESTGLKVGLDYVTLDRPGSDGRAVVTSALGTDRLHIRFQLPALNDSA